MNIVLSEFNVPGNVSVNDYAVLMHHASRVDQSYTPEVTGKSPELPDVLLEMTGWHKGPVYSDPDSGYFGVVYTRGSDAVLVNVGSQFGKYFVLDANGAPNKDSLVNAAGTTNVGFRTYEEKYLTAARTAGESFRNDFSNKNKHIAGESQAGLANQVQLYDDYYNGGNVLKGAFGYNTFNVNEELAERVRASQSVKAPGFKTGDNAYNKYRIINRDNDLVGNSEPPPKGGSGKSVASYISPADTLSEFAKAEKKQGDFFKPALKTLFGYALKDHTAEHLIDNDFRNQAIQKNKELGKDPYFGLDRNLKNGINHETDIIKDTNPTALTSDQFKGFSWLLSNSGDAVERVVSTKSELNNKWNELKAALEDNAQNAQKAASEFFEALGKALYTPKNINGFGYTDWKTGKYTQTSNTQPNIKKANQTLLKHAPQVGKGATNQPVNFAKEVRGQVVKTANDQPGGQAAPKGQQGTGSGSCVAWANTLGPMYYTNRLLYYIKKANDADSKDWYKKMVNMANAVANQNGAQIRAEQSCLVAHGKSPTSFPRIKNAPQGFWSGFFSGLLNFSFNVNVQWSANDLQGSVRSTSTSVNVSGNGVPLGSASSNPLVIDLNGNGAETISLEESNAYFDYLSTGFANRTSWVSKNDALLTIDANQNGIIDNGSEQFGYINAGGFEQLAALDINGDFIIDGTDVAFSLLRVWQDANEDGVTDAGELKTLTEAGIQSISLITQAENILDNGNTVFESVVFNKIGGGTGRVYDVSFNVNPTDTRSTGENLISTDLIYLPWLRGYGLVKDLLVTATEDSNLGDLLKELILEPNGLALYNQMDELMAKWVGIGTAGQAAPGQMDPEKLAFLQRYINIDYQFDNPTTEQIAAVEESYLAIKNKLFVDYISQSQLGYGMGLSYDFAKDTISIDSSVFYDALVQNLTDTQASFSAFIIATTLGEAEVLDTAHLLDAVQRYGYGDFLIGFLNNLNEFTPQNTDGSVTGDALNNLIYSTSQSLNGVLLQGNEGHDWLVSTVGNDTLQGGAGNDTYVLDLQSGHDVIIDSAGVDHLILGAGITADNLILTQNGNDLILQVGTQTLATLQSFYPTGSIEIIRFIDGSSLSSAEILAMTSTINGTAAAEELQGNNFKNLLNGGAGNDTLFAGAGDDTLDGGSGADRMIGGAGNDLYFVDDAQDIIEEIFGESLDTVQSSISYTLSANVENLTLTGSVALVGTGNDSDNQLIGNDAASTLVGGFGDDTYVLLNNSTVIVENANQGIDTVQTGASYTLGANTENLILTGTTALSGFGNALDNKFFANNAASTLVGGLGDDTYIINHAGTSVVENANEGLDSVQTSVSYILSGNIENLTLTGNTALSGTGNELDNRLIANNAASSLTGGLGNDIYLINHAGTVINENLDEGIDTVQSSVSYTLAANVENLVLLGTETLTATGNGLNNFLLGNSADNTLIGGVGADTLVGGFGNDVYEVDHASDSVIENESQGTDTVLASLNYTLGSHVENLTLTGSNALTGTGNELDNQLTSNNAASTLVGGLGNDTYIIQNSATIITENANEGIDTVEASVSYTLGAQIENLTLTGSNVLTGTGNELDNQLTSNNAASTLVGGLGNDTYIIQNSATIITENANEGIDTVEADVSYTLGVQIENLTLTGSNALTGTGNELGNILTGNSSDNTLHGALGADTLVGGQGNDFYVIDNTQDVIVENAGEGIDTAQASVSYSLTEYLENLILTGVNNLQGTGNTYHNQLTGNSGANLLKGLDGDDTLDGGLGADTLIGGTGDDSYIVDDAQDLVVEALNEDLDTVLASLNYTLGSHVENLTLTGTSALLGVGNELDNLLTSNNAASTLVGGLGNDTYIIQNSATLISENANEGIDTVETNISYTLGANIENLTLTGSAALIGAGNSLDNILIGTSGADTLLGGQGNDNYIIQNSATVITENANEGIDTIQSTVSHTLSSNVENLILLEESDLHATGNTLNNQLTGNDGDNTLDGRTGADTLLGGLGNDTYILDHVDDLVIEEAGEGVDTVQSGISHTLSSYLENLILTGLSALTATGNAFANSLVGNNLNNTLNGLAGDDTLDGSLGKDTLVGGSGDDTYYADNAMDVIIEQANEGNDTVIATVNWSLGDHLENLTLDGTTNLSGIGNTADNILLGNDGNNILKGLGGNDTLDGGVGIDTLIGGTGNDVYYVDNTNDIVTENVNEGDDTVYSSVSYTLLSHIENLTLTGNEALTGTGNASNNLLMGNQQANTLTGGEGSDTLDGGAGADILIGSTGDDTYYVDNVGEVVTESAGEGIDTIYSRVSYSLSSQVENLRLLGTDDLSGIGNSLNNLVVGNTGQNTLNGGLGEDILMGGLGDDVYIVDNANDQVVELANEGLDSVITSVSYTLGAETENLILTSGSSAIVGGGNALDNEILGNELNNFLTGFSGQDTLDGGVGADTLAGGSGNDVYILDNTGEVILENTNEGIDGVYASVSHTLATDVENLTLTGNFALVGAGNSLNNVLTGNSALSTLVGGSGNDTFIIENNDTVITENSGEGIDTVQTSSSYTLGNHLENLTLIGYSDSTAVGNSLNNRLSGNIGDNTLDGGSGNDTLLGGLGNDIYVVDNTGDGVSENANEGTDTIQSSVNWSLGSHIENLTLTGSTALSGKGNSLDNVLTGTSGVDTLLGGTGNDTYVIQNSGTVITENANEGTDTVQSTVSYTLGSNVENLTLTGSNALTGTGNSGANVLMGNNANSTLVGGLGNDTYILQNATTTVTESASAGIDTVQIGLDYTLGDHLENLVLTGFADLNGTGNSLDNQITGNLGNNSLASGAGNDTLNGAGGEDTLLGGLGNDTYVITKAEVLIVENAGEGTDTVQTEVDYTLAANLENLSIIGINNLSATGNSANNLLTGNIGHNTLDGGSGNDTLIGGVGNDTYVIDNVGDVITESANEGIDTVQSNLSWSLAANLENLTLTGTNALTAKGNSADNILTGNNANSTLQGGLGNDTYLVHNAATVITENLNEGIDTVQTDLNYTLGANLENLVQTGNFALQGTGNALNNRLSSNNAASTLSGGAGDDIYVVQNSDVVIIENLNEGSDIVQTGLHYTLGTNLEHLTLIGTSNINGTGNAGNNYLTGNSGANTLVALEGNDTLDGGSSADFLYGGLGNDTYIVDHLGDLVIEQAGEGIDTILASVSYTLAANVENLIFTGTSNLLSRGNNANNTLTGNAGNNTLDGGAGNDTLTGGLGNDTYVVDVIGDVIIENASEGTDTIQAGLSWSLAANLENLTLTGTAALTGTGNAGQNVLIGNLGNSTLIGGSGNDTYILQHSQTVVSETASAGTDTVQTNFNYTLGANVENLVLTGGGHFSGTGNSLANNLTGNSGDNTLDGSTGVDTLLGGLGDDTYLVDQGLDVITENAGEGVDLVLASATYTLGTFIENLTLMGNANINGVGNAYGNVITGNSGNNSLSGGAGNDTLNGGIGVDTLVGGTGDDFYFVDGTNDVLMENGSEGIDTVETAISYALANYFENLTLTGNGNLTGTGTAFENALIGNSGNNILSGLGGNDTLDGGLGKDTLIGGTGDDFYSVDNLGDIVIENANEGIDTIQASINYVLGANVENLILTGSATDGLGNAGSNFLQGNAKDNKLDGGAGADILMGGLGNDTYSVDNLDDFVIENENEGVDTLLSSVDFTLGTNLENLQLIGITAILGSGNTENNNLVGNTLNNRLMGFAGHDTLDGGFGEDTLIGETGNDVYIVDNLLDQVHEFSNEGFDTVQASVSYVLSQNIENLSLTGTGNINATGNSLDNILIGNTGNNVLNGGAGDDTYRVLMNSGNDTLVDSSGLDTLDFSGFGGPLSINLNSSTMNVAFSPIANSTKSLLDFNSKADGTNVVSDYFGNSWTAHGNAQIGSTNSWKAGEKYVTLDGSGDYIKANGQALNGDNFTLRWHQKFNSLSGIQTLLNPATGDYPVAIQMNGNTLWWYLSSTGSSWNIANAQASSKSNWTTGQWYEFEFSYSATGGYKIFVDGNLEISNTATSKLYNPGAFILGAYSSGGFASNGAISDVYFTNTEVLHNANFTPLTEGYEKQYQGSLNWENASIENVISGSGNDTLTGNNEDNTLNGGLGNDALLGGAGNDTYAFAVNFGRDTISDASGQDAIDLSALSTDLNVNLASNSFTFDVNNVITWANNTLETLRGGSGNDQLSGNSQDNLLLGNAGQDTLNGGAGNDTLSGGTGNDTYVVTGSFGVDTITDAEGLNLLDLQAFGSSVSFNLGSTSFSDGSGNNISWTASNIEGVKTGAGNDTLIGNASNNYLLSGGGADSLYGNSGNDLLNGGGGNDLLSGGDGDDTYLFENNSGNDTVSDSSGNDSVDFSQYSTGITANLTLSSVTLPSGPPASNQKSSFDLNSKANGSNVITDYYGNAWTAFGNAQIGNSNMWKSGEKHIVLDGSGDYVKTTAAVPNGDNFTIRWRQRFDNFSGYRTLLNTVNYRSLALTFSNTNLVFSLSSNNSSWNIASATAQKTNWATNQWYEFEVSYSNTSGYRLFIDGVLDTQVSSTTKMYSPGGLVLGAYSMGTYGAAGALSDFYFTNTEVLHTASFTPLSSSWSDQFSSSGLDWSSASIENLVGGAGNDVLTGNADNNVLSGGAGSDSLLGGDGNDTLAGGAGTNTLEGGVGNDVYVLSNSSDLQSINDTGGVDTLDVSAYVAGVQLSLDTPVTTASNQKSALDLNSKANGSNVITDYYGNAWTAYGNAQIGSSSAWKSGEKHILLDGSGDYVKTTAAVPNGDNFTIRWRQRFDNFSGYRTLLNTVNYRSLALTFSNTNLVFSLSSNNSSWNIASATAQKTNWATNQWYEFEVSYSNTSGYRLFIDGVLDTQVSSTTKMYSPGGLVLGAYSMGTYGAAGALSDFYFTNTEVLHTTNFTPSTNAYMNNSGSVSVSWNTGALENIVAGIGNDMLTGNEQHNQIQAGDGNDTLQGGLGNDTLIGGLGNDTYRVELGAGLDEIQETSGNDSLDLSALGQAIQLNLSLDTTYLVSTGNSVSWSFGALENIITGSGNDELTGTTSANLLNAGAGNDTLMGADGNDTLLGGDGNDTYRFDQVVGRTFITDTQGVDTLDFTNSTESLQINLMEGSYNVSQNSLLLWSGSQIERLITGSGHDNLIGSDVSNTLISGLGNDTLSGEGGNDLLQGGQGDDRYVFGFGSGRDTIEDASGSNTLDFSSLTADLVIDLNQDRLNLLFSPAANSTKSLLDFNSKANGSTVVSDYFGNSWTAYGNAQIGSANSWKAGEKYVTLDGSGDYIRANSQSLNGDNFTLRWRQKFNSWSGIQTLLNPATGDYPFAIQMSGSTLLWYLSSTGSSFNIANAQTSNKSNWVTGQWYEFEFSYSATGGYKLFVDGNLEISNNATSKLYNPGAFILGAYSSGGYASNGAISDIYFTNTEALHSANFTPLTEGYLNQLTDSVNWNGSNIDNVVGGSGNDTLSGTFGNNQLTGGNGNDTLIGGAGDDTYSFGLENGQDIISDSSGTDTLLFDSSVSLSTVVFFQTGTGDLQIGYTNGSIDFITVQGQNNSGSAVERFELSNGQFMTAAEVNQILSDMSAYASLNDISLNSLDDVKADANLIALANGGWHS